MGEAALSVTILQAEKTEMGGQGPSFIVLCIRDKVWRIFGKEATTHILVGKKPH